MNLGSQFVKWLTAVVLATTIAVIALPGHRAVTLASGALAALALVLAEMGGIAYRLAGGRDSMWQRVRHVPEPKVERPADLERIERGLGWGRYSVGDFNYRVRPMLRRLTAHRLREVHALDIEARPDDARAIVSPELWELVVAKEAPESERVIGTAEIARMVEEIERI